MNTEYKIYAALAILAAGAGGIYLTGQNKKEQAVKHSVTATSADLPTIAVPKDDTEKITKLEIQSPDKDDKTKVTKVTLEKKARDLATQIDDIRDELEDQSANKEALRRTNQALEDELLEGVPSSSRAWRWTIAAPARHASSDACTISSVVIGTFGFVDRSTSEPVTAACTITAFEELRSGKVPAHDGCLLT